MEHESFSQEKSAETVDHHKQHEADKQALHQRWFSNENFKEKFGLIRPNRLEDPDFIQNVRAVFVEELELDLTKPDDNSHDDQDYAALEKIRNNQLAPYARNLAQYIIRIGQDLQLSYGELEKLQKLFLEEKEK